MLVETMPLAAFVYPGLFAAGASAVALPILIHLLARRRFRRVRWAALDFLLEAHRKNIRRVRMEQLILLLLRCLAVLLIALIISRPFVRPQGWAAVFGGQKRSERILLIDDSYSMGYEEPDGTWFETGKKNLIGLINWVHQNAPSDAVTVLCTSDPLNPLASGISLNEATVQELISRVEALQPSQERANFAQSFAAIKSLLDENPDVLEAKLFVLSDFQRADWEPASQPRDRGPDSPFFPLIQGDGADRTLHTILVGCGGDGAANVSIARITADAGPIVAGIPAEVTALVTNQSSTTSESLDIQIDIGPTRVETQTTSAIEAGQDAPVACSLVLPNAGHEYLRFELPPDGLPLDNARYAAVKVDESVSVLIVNGEPSTESYQDETDLLEAALRPHGPVFSGNTVQVIDETELFNTDLSSFHLVIVANVYRIARPAVERLEEFVASGGGLLLFLGDQVDPTAYNETLFARGEGLLPLPLGELARLQSPCSLAGGDFDHPVISVFGGRDNPFLRGIGFGSFYGLGSVDPTLAPTDPNDTPSGRRSLPPSVLLRLSGADQSPLLVEQRFGSGRVILATSSCDLEWNDWAKDPSYVVTMLELARYLARRPTHITGIEVGEPIVLELDPGDYAPEAVLRTPGYPAEKEIQLAAFATDDGQGLVLRWIQTDRTGIFSIILDRRDGTADARLVAVNVDPEEGNLAVASEADLRQYWPKLAFAYLESVDALNEVDAVGRSELWRNFLGLALIVLLGEQALAFWFGRRG